MRRFRFLRRRGLERECGLGFDDGRLGDRLGDRSHWSDRSDRSDRSHQGGTGRPGVRLPVHRRGPFGLDGRQGDRRCRRESEDALFDERFVDAPRGTRQEERAERLARAIGGVRRRRERLETHGGQGRDRGQVEERLSGGRARGSRVSESSKGSESSGGSPRRPRCCRGLRRRPFQSDDAGVQEIDLCVAVVEEPVKVEPLTRPARLSRGDVGFDQQLVRDELGRIARHRAFEDLDRRDSVVRLHQTAPEGDLGGEVVRMLLEAGTQDVDGVAEATGAAILLRELQEGARLGVALPALPKLVQLFGRERLRHAALRSWGGPRRPLRNVASA